MNKINTNISNNVIKKYFDAVEQFENKKKYTYKEIASLKVFLYCNKHNLSLEECAKKFNIETKRLVSLTSMKKVNKIAEKEFKKYKEFGLTERELHYYNVEVYKDAVDKRVNKLTTKNKID